jgi:hypothetical protein
MVKVTRWRAILLGGLTVGALDILDAFIFFWLRNHVRPMRILQAIAAGLLGREDAIAGGATTAALGLLLHFLIAFSIVIVCYLAARQFPALVRRPLITGPIYGLIVYAVMNYIVIPLSAAPGSSNLPPWPVLINGLLIHIAGVGTPAMLFARTALIKGDSNARALRR